MEDINSSPYHTINMVRLLLYGNITSSPSFPRWSRSWVQIPSKTAYEPKIHSIISWQLTNYESVISLLDNYFQVQTNWQLVRGKLVISSPTSQNKSMISSSTSSFDNCTSRVYTMSECLVLVSEVLVWSMDIFHPWGFFSFLFFLFLFLCLVLVSFPFYFSLTRYMLLHTLTTTSGIIMGEHLPVIC